MQVQASPRRAVTTAIEFHSLSHFSSTREIIDLATTVCRSIDYAVRVPLLGFSYHAFPVDNE
jgi:hypothetical protein